MGFKAIKNLLPVTGVILLAAGAAFGGDFTVWNTGEAANGTALGNGTVDPNWTITASTDPSITPPASAYAVSPYTNYVANTSNSSWINPTGNSSQLFLGDTYSYTTTFSLPGAPTAYTSLSGAFAADDTAEILLNGNVVAGPGWGHYWEWLGFDITNGFQAGTNTLTFVVDNSTGGQTGLQVQFTGETYAPEPGSVALAGAGLLAFGFLFRKVRARS